MMHAAILEDPDVRDAVETFRPHVVQIRQLSGAMFALPDNAANVDQRASMQAAIDDLVDGMRLRCERIPLTLDGLFRLINDDLSERERQGDTRKPHGDYLRALIDENTCAYALEAQLHREMSAIHGRIQAATQRRLAADRACAGFVAGWAVRGGGR